jgi:outer membrane immunogenic protein
MTRIASGLIASLALFATPALSADLPVKASAPPLSLYNWTGCFAGINGGGARSDNAWQPLAGTVLATTGPSGFAAGGQIGCDYQTGSLVVGIEAQFDWIDAENAAAAQGGGGSELSSRLKMFGTAGGRIGYAFDRVLPYVKVGLAGARYRQEVDTIGATTVTPFIGGNQNVLGIATGAGIEVAVFSNLSFKAEYDFAYLGTNGAALSCVSPACAGTPTVSLDIRQNFQSILFGVNYRFY